MAGFNSSQFEKQLLQALAAEASLSNDTKQVLKKLETKNNPYQDELIKRWREVTFPLYNMNTIMQLNISHKQAIAATNLTRQNQRAWLEQMGHHNAAANIVDLVDASITAKSSCIVKDAEKTMGWNPLEERFVLIENTEKISLDNHLKDIEVCAYSKGLNVPKSIYNIIIKGQQYGYNEEQFGDIFLQFIKLYLKDHYTSAMSFSMSTNSLFNHLVSLIDTSSQIKMVRKELANVKRKPGDALAQAVLKVKSLTASLLWMLSPTDDIIKVTRKADKAAIRCIGSLLEDKTRAQFNGWVRKNIEMEAKKSLNEHLEAANMFENIKGYELCSEKHVREEVSDIDLQVNSFFSRNNMQPPRAQSPRTPPRSRSPSMSGRQSRSSQSSGSRATSYSREPSVDKEQYKKEQERRRRPERKKGEENRSFSRNKTDKPGRRKDRAYREQSYESTCKKCGSNRHGSKACRRYPFFYKSPCSKCEKGLFHPEDLCRFSDSRYVTPGKLESPKSFKKETFMDNVFSKN